MRKDVRPRRGKGERGFTLIDALLAMMIMLVALMALSGAMTAAVLNTKRTQQLLKAKQIANSTLESIFSVRDISLARNASNFANLQNAPAGVFVTGERAVGTGTGPDGIIGTADDDGEEVPGFTRTITITDVENPERPTSEGWDITMRKVELTIAWQDGGTRCEDKTVTYVTDYARAATN